MILPTPEQVQNFDVATLVVIANRMGISRAQWDRPEQLRKIMLERAEKAWESDPHPPCGGEPNE